MVYSEYSKLLQPVAFDSFKVHRIRFRPGLHPDPTRGAYSAAPGPLAGLRGLTSKGRLRRGREPQRGNEEGKGRGREGEGPPPSQIPGSAPGSKHSTKYVLYVSIEMNARQCYFTVFATFRCHLHSADSPVSE